MILIQKYHFFFKYLLCPQSVAVSCCEQLSLLTDQITKLLGYFTYENRQVMYKLEK